MPQRWSFPGLSPTIIQEWGYLSVLRGEVVWEGAGKKHWHVERKAQEQQRTSPVRVKPRSLTCWCGLISATSWVEIGFQESLWISEFVNIRVCVHQFVYISHRVLLLVKSTTGSGGLWADPASVRGCSRRDVVSCHQSSSPLEGRVLLGLWKLSLILKQLGGKAWARERLARMGLRSLERESSAGP